jgi:hypothetical protein
MSTVISAAPSSTLPVNPSKIDRRHPAPDVRSNQH